MRRNVILLIDADVETCGAARTASQPVGLDVRFAKIYRDFSEIADLGRDDVVAIVLDYDPDVHGPAIVETLERWLPSRPLIFISSAEDLRHPVVAAGGAAKHLVKPVTAQRLVHAIKTVVHDPGCRCPSCDRWGHPREDFGNGSNRRNKVVAGV
jgi:DNA-binding NtrC family response regulator